MIQRFQDDDLLKGLLVFTPFVLSVTSLCFGIKLGLIASSLILLLALIIFSSHKLFALPQQRLVFVLITSVTLLLICRMLLEAESYPFLNAIGLFFPLLLINSLVLSVNESVFSISDCNVVIRYIAKLAATVLLFFIIIGLLKESFNEWSFLTSPAGYLFLFGFMFAAISFFNNKRLCK
jgi:Na+-translocating ferredoxin:NAD+ oxidoreductase RnfE subunit